jgi:hypothetical protein
VMVPRRSVVDCEKPLMDAAAVKRRYTNSRRRPGFARIATTPDE